MRHTVRPDLHSIDNAPALAVPTDECAMTPFPELPHLAVPELHVFEQGEAGIGATPFRVSGDLASN
ncbi:hypothetical protein PCAR4_350187 [Paraburkholderia caribensis]|nr:hypothetical protein PCAR4_350187 [Paraburkholderia caribensis]